MKNRSQSQAGVIAVVLAGSQSNAEPLTISDKNRQLAGVADDRYPGSYFQIPGVPVPGKTTWSLVR